MVDVMRRQRVTASWVRWPQSERLRRRQRWYFALMGVCLVLILLAWNLVRLWSTIPGVSTRTAEMMVAEIGADMGRFPSAKHLAAWAGLAPASHESAGKRRPAGTRQGSRHLQGALVEAARAAARTKGTFLSERYKRIARRRGPNKAAVAIAHSMLVAAYHMAITGEIYRDLGSGYYDNRKDPKAKVNRHVKELQAAGYTVNLTPAA